MKVFCNPSGVEELSGVYVVTILGLLRSLFIDFDLEKLLKKVTYFS